MFAIPVKFSVVDYETGEISAGKSQNQGNISTDNGTKLSVSIRVKADTMNLVYALTFSFIRIWIWNIIKGALLENLQSKFLQEHLLKDLN